MTIVFENPSSPCMWDKCELGPKGNHPPYEWKAHQQYAGASPMMNPTMPFNLNENAAPAPPPQTQTVYYNTQGQVMPSGKAKFAQGLAIGCLFMAGFIIVTAAIQVALR